MFEELRAAMNAAGIDPSVAPLIADGRLRRFHLPTDRRGTLNGWIVLHDNGDGSHGAAFGRWGGEKYTWHSRGAERLTSAERADFARRMREARRKAAKEQAQRHAQATEDAARILRRSRPADPAHPYLVRKRVKPYSLRQLGERLVIPMRTADGKLTGCQYIDPDGNKRFHPGTAKRGAYFAIGGRSGDVLLIAEGYATAATIHDATGHPVAVAFDAGNLRPVAEALHKKHPGCRLVICADDDEAGIKGATEAAEAVGGIIIKPDFNKRLSHG